MDRWHHAPMEKKGYERLIKKELLHEARLRHIEKKCAKLVIDAKKESEQLFREILIVSAKEVEQKQILLEKDYEEYLSLLQEQIATYKKKMQKKEEQLPLISALIANRFIEEWT